MVGRSDFLRTLPVDITGRHVWRRRTLEGLRHFRAEGAQSPGAPT